MLESDDAFPLVPLIPNAMTLIQLTYYLRSEKRPLQLLILAVPASVIFHVCATFKDQGAIDRPFVLLTARLFLSASRRGIPATTRGSSSTLQ